MKAQNQAGNNNEDVAVAAIAALVGINDPKRRSQIVNNLVGQQLGNAMRQLSDVQNLIEAAKNNFYSHRNEYGA